VHQVGFHYTEIKTICEAKCSSS